MGGFEDARPERAEAGSGCSIQWGVVGVEGLHGVVRGGVVSSVERDGRRLAASPSRMSVYRCFEANRVRLSSRGREGNARSLATERNAPSQAARGIGWGMGHGRSLWPGGRSGQEAVRSGARARRDGLPAILGRGGKPRFRRSRGAGWQSGGGVNARVAQSSSLRNRLSASRMMEDSVHRSSNARMRSASDSSS